MVLTEEQQRNEAVSAAINSEDCEVLGPVDTDNAKTVKPNKVNYNPRYRL